MNWQLFSSIYLLIFLAELPDKTAFATLLLATRNSATAVFFGVSLAFLIQTLVAVAFGSVIALFPEKWVHLAAGVLFLVFAFMAWRDRNESDKDESEFEKNDSSAANASKTRKYLRAVWGAFWVIFIAEWGDLTQLATASLAAHNPKDLVTIAVAATLSLWSVSALVVFLGNRIRDRVPTRLLHLLTAVIFAAIGVYFIVTI